MTKLLIFVGRAAGIFGALLGIVAVTARAMGTWHLGSLQIGTLLLGSIAAMVLGTLAYAAAVAEQHNG
ncbi:MAG TPA: hypothetical protein VLC09_16660 [Polyangiaceae bacterium]|nr:hypothetical protein [Polyangiaceae bacterium]